MLVRFCYRWLPIFFGCHCRPDRSFHLRGVQFPVCARCTGILAGMLAALATLWLWVPRPWALILMLAPLVIDGAVQHRTRYESNNLRRFLTGLLYGYAMIVLAWLFLRSGYRLGVRIGEGLR